jgi:hypothetical protein
MMLVYFMDIWYMLRPFGTFYGHLVYFVGIWNRFSRFGMLYQEKSGNPAWHFYFCVRTVRTYQGGVQALQQSSDDVDAASSDQLLAIDVMASEKKKS